MSPTVSPQQKKPACPQSMHVAAQHVVPVTHASSGAQHARDAMPHIAAVRHLLVRQSRPPSHVSPAQHCWASPPHAWHTPPVHTSPASHVVPSQHASPSPLHAIIRHAPPKHVSPAVHAMPGQHPSSSPPHVPG